MLQQQKQSLESLVRVRAFMGRHPVTGPLTYGDAGTILDEVIQRCRELAGAQLTGKELSRGEARRQRQLVGQLLDEHVRPLVAIARAQVEPLADGRLPTTIRMPRAGSGVTKMLQACDGLIEAARPFESTFITLGLPADFLARFTAARHELATMLGGRADQVAMHIAARTGLAVELRRGRAAVRRVDSVVRASFRGEPATLAVWRAVKRTHLPAARISERGPGLEIDAEAELPVQAPVLTPVQTPLTPEQPPLQALPQAA